MLPEDLAGEMYAALERHVRKQYPDHPDHDDMIQDAMEAACRAATRFDPGHGAPLVAFLMIRATGAVADSHRRSYGRSGHRTGGHRRMETSLDRDDYRWQAARDPVDPYEPVEDRHLITQAARGLGDKDRRYLGLMATGMNNSEVCAAMGVTDAAGVHRANRIRRSLTGASR